MEEGRRKKEEGDEARFRRLIAWQKADELASSIFQALQRRPTPAWLATQVTKAAVSVPANIAEGHARGALKDYLRFLDIARGSSAEVEYYLHFMFTNKLLEESVYGRLTRLHSDAGNLLLALIRSLRLKLKEGSWSRVSDELAEYSVGPLDESLLPPSSFLLPGEEG